MASLGFTRLVHADWSTSADKRWFAEARSASTGWIVEVPRLVGPIAAFLHDLLSPPQPTLAGFDFPIGLPAAFGERTELSGFIEGLEAFGRDAWSRFYEVAERAADVSVHRPFYPRVSSRHARQAHLLTALGITDISRLRRECERATGQRRAACAVFWTLGGNQVGKAAISGWRDLVQPARQAGARLWPFDGSLMSLAEAGRLVICETYPAEAYGHLGIRFANGGSKRRQADRRVATALLLSDCDDRRISVSDDMRRAIADGFGSGRSSEDSFDATIGLLGMIEVAEGRRAACPAFTKAPHWEGWILGQAGSRAVEPVPRGELS